MILKVKIFNKLWILSHYIFRTKNKKAKGWQKMLKFLKLLKNFLINYQKKWKII